MLAAQELTGPEREMAALVEQVRGLLDEQTSALAAADAHVQDLVRVQQAYAEAVAAAVFQSRVNAAQGAASSNPSLIDPNLPAPTLQIATVLTVARQQLGQAYVWGAVGPDSFDCSGFTGYAYAATGIALPRTVAQQYLAGSIPGWPSSCPETYSLGHNFQPGIKH